MPHITGPPSVALCPATSRPWGIVLRQAGWRRRPGRAGGRPLPSSALPGGCARAAILLWYRPACIPAPKRASHAVHRRQKLRSHRTRRGRSETAYRFDRLQQHWEIIPCPSGIFPISGSLGDSPWSIWTDTVAKIIDTNPRGRELGSTFEADGRWLEACHARNHTGHLRRV